MTEKLLCMGCREEKRTTCLIKDEMEKLQSQMPQQGRTDADLAKIQSLIAEEKKTHDLARERGCLNHNDHTLTIPRIEYS